MSDETVILRRSWPQRLVILACLGVIGASITAAFFVRNLYEGVAEIGRIQFSGDLLVTETDPSEPVNFLIIGLDSAEGIDPTDPVTNREVDPRGRHQADSISMVRVDPVGGQAWVMSIPRDLIVDIPGSTRQRINAASLIGGAPLLVQTISETFDIQINHYVQLDFLAFRELVDDLDGVPMWFPYAARDSESGLNVPAGCNVLGRQQALAFVRSRRYQEFRDDAWVTIGAGTDTARIERQQAFVVAALERAIARGARNPTTMSALISAGAESVVLDQGLTPAELIQLAEAFTDFDTDSLVRYSPAVVEVGPALELSEPLDSTMFQVFRGQADAISLGDVRFSVAGTDQTSIVDSTELLRGLGFSVGSERLITGAGADNVIVYPTGGREEAELLARYVIPIPAIVEDATATEMTLALGSEFYGISIFLPHAEGETDAAIAAFGDVDVPSLTEQTSTTASTTSTTVAPTTTGGETTDETTTTTAPAPTTVAPTTTTTTLAPTTSEAVLPGRPPEGESCG